MEMVFNWFKGEPAMRRRELLEYILIWLLWGLVLLFFYGYWFLGWFDG
jgi:membrane associated rhomboid family serine protease